MNKTTASIIKIIAKLVNYDPNDMLAENFLMHIEKVPINFYKSKVDTLLRGRKWIAPLYKPSAGSWNIRAGQYIMARIFKRTVDVEFIDEVKKENIVITMLKRDWREKVGYFYFIPAARLRGGLGDVVNNLIRVKRGYGHKYGNKPFRTRNRKPKNTA